MRQLVIEVDSTKPDGLYVATFKIDGEYVLNPYGDIISEIFDDETPIPQDTIISIIKMCCND